MKREKNNIRLFDDEAIRWLTGVKYLKECGMSIDAIKQFVDLCVEGDSTILARYKIILEQTKIAQKRLEEAKRTAEYMEYKANHYRQIVDQRIPDDTNPGKWDQIPV